MKLPNSGNPDTLPLEKKFVAHAINNYIPHYMCNEFKQLFLHIHSVMIVKQL